MVAMIMLIISEVNIFYAVYLYLCDCGQLFCV